MDSMAWAFRARSASAALRWNGDQQTVAVKPTASFPCWSLACSDRQCGNDRQYTWSLSVPKKEKTLNSAQLLTMRLQEIVSPYASYLPFLLIFPLTPRTVHRLVMVIIFIGCWFFAFHRSGPWTLRLRGHSNWMSWKSWLHGRLANEGCAEDNWGKDFEAVNGGFDMFWLCVLKACSRIFWSREDQTIAQPHDAQKDPSLARTATERERVRSPPGPQTTRFALDPCTAARVDSDGWIALRPKRAKWLGSACLVLNGA